MTVVSALLGAALAALIGIILVQRPTTEVPAEIQDVEEKAGHVEDQVTSEEEVSDLPEVHIDAEEAKEALAGWEQLSDQRSDLSFSYPSAWGEPSVEFNQVDPELFYPVVDTLSANFPTSDQVILRAVELTERADYDGTDHESDMERLHDFFRTGSVYGTQPLWLPPSNSVIIYWSTPQFIQSVDGSIRGAFYYAHMGQNDAQQNEDIKKLNHFVMVLTDGNGSVLQYHMALDLEEGDYETIGKCLSISGSAECKVSTDLSEALESTYKFIPDGIEIN